MKKVLILAYDFPPWHSAGAQRPFSWMRYLPEHDWHPVVVTRHWDEGIREPVDTLRSSSDQDIRVQEESTHTLIRVPYRASFRDRLLLRYGSNRFVLLRKLLSFLMAYARFYLPWCDPARPILKQADLYLSGAGADLIIATGEPFILFKYAFLLHKKHKIPFVLDYRDGWTTGRSLDLYQKKQKTITRFIFRSMERHFLKHAAMVISPSPDYIRHLSSLGKFPSEIIYNGYFPEYLNSNSCAENNSIFTIIYSGIIYPFQPLDQFLKGLSKAIYGSSELKIKLKFIGTEINSEKLNSIQKNIDKNRIIIELSPRMNSKDYSEALMRADLLLLLTSEGSEWLNAKLFDYLAARRMILLFTGDKGLMEKIILETGSGVVCHTEEELTRFLPDAYSEFLANGKVAGTASPPETFSRKNQAARLAKILDSCVE